MVPPLSVCITLLADWILSPFLVSQTSLQWSYRLQVAAPWVHERVHLRQCPGLAPHHLLDNGKLEDMVAELVSALDCNHLRATCSQNMSRLSSEREIGLREPTNDRDNWTRAKGGRQSGEEEPSLRQALQGGVAGTSHCRNVSLWVRNGKIVALVKLIVRNRTIAMMLTNKSMRANIIARTAALLSLEFALASAVYAAMYVWRIVPATKNFPHILRHVSSTLATANMRLTSSTSRRRDIQMNTRTSGQSSPFLPCI